MHLYSAHRSKTNTIKKNKTRNFNMIIQVVTVGDTSRKEFYACLYNFIFENCEKQRSLLCLYTRKTTVYNFLIQITYLFSCTSLIDILPCYQNVKEIQRKGSVMFKSSVSIGSNVSDDAVTPLPLKKVCMVIIVNKTQNTPT